MFDPFDLNKDGKLDPAEAYLKFTMIMGDEEDEKDDLADNDDLFASDDEKEDELESELELYGLDRFDLELMDEDERRQAIEDAGLDPDDFDSLF